MASPLKTSDELEKELRAVLTEVSGFQRGNFEMEGRSRAAVLALFRGESFLTSEILLILRAPNLAINPGQVAFPGGALETIDDGDSIRTALRETFEEVGLPPEAVLPLGLLPPLPTVAGHFMVETVLGVSRGLEHEMLRLQASEVAHAEWMSVESLIQSRKTEQRMVHGVEMELPVFRALFRPPFQTPFEGGEQRMWGLTAMIFDLICIRYDKLFS